MNPTGFEVPEENEVDHLAFQLLAKANPLDLQVMEDVLAEPRRFRDLSRFVQGKSLTPLVRALNRLGDAGLVRQGMNLRDPDDPRYYSATRLAVQVFAAVTEHRLLAKMRSFDAPAVAA